MSYFCRTKVVIVVILWVIVSNDHLANSFQINLSKNTLMNIQDTWPGGIYCKEDKNKRPVFSFAEDDQEYLSPDNSESEEDYENYSAPEYRGPILEDPSQLEGGIQIPDYGVILGAGPSVVAPGGRGLYLMVDTEEVDQVVLPAGAPLCRYAEGSMQQAFEGDKTVGFAFTSADTEVFFNQHLQPLRDVLNEVATGIEEEDTKRVQGHLVLFDSETQDIVLVLDPDFKGPRYFIPNDNADFSAKGLGQYANDLAGGSSAVLLGKEEYLKASEEKNIIQLAWRLELHDGILCPTWPVSILTKDVLLTSSQPMELGCSYGWRFWEQQSVGS